MNPAAGLRHRHTLHPVNPAFVFQTAVGSLSLHDINQFLDPADVCIAGTGDNNPPALPLGIAAVHPEQHGPEQGRLFPAGAAADFHDDILFIHRIPGQKKQLDLMEQHVHFPLQIPLLLLCDLPQFPVMGTVQQFLRILLLFLRLLVLPVASHDFLQGSMLPDQTLPFLLAADHIRIGKELTQFLISIFHKL